MSAVARFLARAWSGLSQAIVARNDRAVAAWGSSLQYKRYQTNPDEAKRYRVVR